MSKKREFPILNGKLISDLDANGHEIKRLRLTQDQVVDVIKLVGVVPFIEDADKNKTAVTIGSRKVGKNVGQHSLANGYEVTASGEHAHAEGYYAIASGNYSHAEGFYAHTKAQDLHAFAWNGDEARIAPYESHGTGTFNINPYGGLDGFYIGEQTLPQVINAVIADAQIDSKINTIVADDAGKSARTIAAEEVAKVVADAPADFDTLKEIAEYIESDKTGAAQMVTKIDANANAISAEAQRAQEAEAALRQEVDGKADKVANATAGNLATLDENGNLVDSGKAIGDFALAKSLAPAFVSYNAYEVGDLCTSFDNDEHHRGTWLYKCILATDGSQLTMPEIDPTHWALATVEDLLAVLRRTVDGKVDAEAGKGLSSNDYTNEDKAKLTGIEAGAQKNPDLSGYATKDAALPRYQFTSAGIIDGVVTIPPYVYASMLSDGTAFTVAVGEGNGYMRDCILIVECGDVAPTITWPANFHPRTDAETDFACVAGVDNVYWISEYVQGEFAVAGWQATAGGSAV